MIRSRTCCPFRLMLALTMLAPLAHTHSAVAARHSWTAGLGPVFAPPFRADFGSLSGGAASLQRTMGPRWTAIGRLAYLRSGGSANDVLARALNQFFLSYSTNSSETDEYASFGLGMRLYPERMADGPRGVFAEISPQLVWNRLSYTGGSGTAFYPGLQLGAGFLIPAWGTSAIEVAAYSYNTGGRLVSRPDDTGGRSSSTSDGINTYLISAAFTVGL